MTSSDYQQLSALHQQMADLYASIASGVPASAQPAYATAPRQYNSAPESSNFRGDDRGERKPFTGTIQNPNAEITPKQLGLLEKMGGANQQAQAQYGQNLDQLTKGQASDLITYMKAQPQQRAAGAPF
jgi:hypothetical protein